MNHTNEETNQIQNRFPITSPFVTGKIVNELIRLIPDPHMPIVVVCIGTDRSTGDSLGPLTGTLLKERRPENLIIYGTLEEPVHGKNLADYLALIDEKHPNAFIIALDACLGRATSIGTIIVGNGPLKPGAALNKTLPPTGNIHIAGVVNIGGMMEFFVLQNTRLNLVMKMARKLSESLKRTDRQITRKKQEMPAHKHKIAETILFPTKQRETERI
ncbi:spore protease YyaC [Salipaludibacillus daqingensis]|uniref:spore protease YyaC n=1 Tax=Salipaludibacillus daqingensis TaxID=3041001 RepID=UPI0024738CD5|nr:spore protease YyaC [Salipaludibacillus daqingensis]